ncbi:hypothetical protein [Nonomuraea sp. NPDC049784]|uniref:hypothetical protein n=1 Tax=Nonomuraea sp. NPDC049784 TaxID=3154361 RepID=UPI0033E3605E
MCYELVPDDHWSDGVSDAVPGRSLYRRTRILSAVLAPYGLTVSDPGTGPHCVIANRKGAAEVAAGLPAVWQVAQNLSSRRIDVLDPVLLEALAPGPSGADA